MMGLHSSPAKARETVVSTMETVSIIPRCADMTDGRPNTVESLQEFLMNFLFAVTDKSSCGLRSMRNVLLEMTLELAVGNSSEVWAL